MSSKQRTVATSRRCAADGSSMQPSSKTVTGGGWLSTTGENEDEQLQQHQQQQQQQPDRQQTTRGRRGAPAMHFKTKKSDLSAVRPVNGAACRDEETEGNGPWRSSTGDSSKGRDIGGGGVTGGSLKRRRALHLTVCLFGTCTLLLLESSFRRTLLESSQRLEAETLASSSPVLAPPSATPVVVNNNYYNNSSSVVGRNFSWVLDFAVAGFSKCGTTFLMHYFQNGRNTFVHKGEVCHLSRNRPINLARANQKVGRQNEFGEPLQVGLKCPFELESEHGLKHYAKYFARTKFVISTRHPVHWFRSFYNFRLYHRWPSFRPSNISELIGPCRTDGPYVCVFHCKATGGDNVCTNSANFHHALSRFGKTPMNTSDEMALLGHDMSIHPNPRAKIFLLEVRQLDGKEESSKNVPEDLRRFLDLPNDLPDLEEHARKHKQYVEEERIAEFIDICNEEYKELRKVLVANGREAATWIRDYFIHSPDVFVSSPQRFLELIDDWGTDPCDV